MSSDNPASEKPKRKTASRRKKTPSETLPEPSAPVREDALPNVLPVSVVQQDGPDSLDQLLILNTETKKGTGTKDDVLTGPWDPYTAAGTNADDPPVHVEHGYQAPVELNEDDINLFAQADKERKSHEVEEKKLELKTVARYYEKPSIPNQFQLYPDTCRVGPVQYKIFRMDEDEKSVAECNKFLERAYPEAAPSIIVVGVDKQFDEKKTGWLMLISYREVTYKKIKT